MIRICEFSMAMKHIQQIYTKRVNRVIVSQIQVIVKQSEAAIR